jgi:hypothetical protein
MIYDIQKNDLTEVDCVEAAMERRQVDAIKIGNFVTLSEVGRDFLGGNDLSPLTIHVDSGQAGL